MTETTRGPRAHGRYFLVQALTALLLLGVAVQPASADPWYEESFSSGNTDVVGGWGWTGSGSGHRGAGLHTRIREGSHYGATAHVQLSELGITDRDEMYWRYWLKLDPDFWIEAPYRGKLPGPAGLYSSGCRGGMVSTTSAPCWSARTTFSRDSYPSPSDGTYVERPNERTRLGSYVYHLDGPDNRGDLLPWDGLLQHGKWYCVEGRVRMNTPGEPDGVLQAWIGGQQRLDRTDLRFRRTGETHLGVRSMWMNVYYGGKGTSPRDNDVWIDSLALSRERIGCDDQRGYDFGDHSGSVHRQAIDWLAARGITRGCNQPQNTSFCPNEPVTRAQMATFLARALELPPADGDPFTDDDGSAFESAIAAVAAAGVTRGCNPPHNDRFCPDDLVTRAQMAAFLHRAWPLPDGPNPFTDVEGMFEGDIGALAESGITRGCNPPENTRYCPGEPVTRAQMATFVRRAAVRYPVG